MTWRRGLFRLWIVLTCSWLALVGAVSARAVQINVAALFLHPLSSPVPTQYAPYVPRAPATEVTDPVLLAALNDSAVPTLVSIATIALGPPVLALLLGWAVAWVAAGFQKDAV